MNYQEMSDFDINCAVARLIGDEVYSNNKDCTKHKAYRIGDRYRDVYSSGWSTDVFDPCNSWADAGPIIQENGINLMASKVVGSGGLKEWEAMSYEGNCHHWGELNPLRAAMIVFLMMKGGE